MNLTINSSEKSTTTPNPKAQRCKQSVEKMIKCIHTLHHAWLAWSMFNEERDYLLVSLLVALLMSLLGFRLSWRATLNPKRWKQSVEKLIKYIHTLHKKLKDIDHANQARPDSYHEHRWTHLIRNIDGSSRLVPVEKYIHTLHKKLKDLDHASQARSRR